MLSSQGNLHGQKGNLFAKITQVDISLHAIENHKVGVSARKPNQNLKPAYVSLSRYI